MSATCDFANLPREMQRMLFSFLRKSDLKIVRLVSKQWSVVAATLLWSKITIDLIDTDKRKVAAIINSIPGGVLDNIKELTISNPAQKKLDPQLRSQAASNLLAILGALPRDTLISFRSAFFRLDQNILGILLRNQKRLISLVFAPNENNQDGLPGLNYIRGNLTKMRDITIYVTGSRSQTYRGLADWFPHALELRVLSIRGRLAAPNQFDGWTLPAGAPLIKLSKLCLEDLHLSDSTGSVATLLQLPCLKDLSFHNCINTGPLLRSFVRRYKETSNFALESFTHDTARVSEDDCKASQELLESVEGLKYIAWGASNSKFLKTKSLERTGKTLQSLHLWASDHCSARELEHLVIICPDLRVLGLSLGDLSQVVDSLEMLEPCIISTLEEYAMPLAVLAQHSKLHALYLSDRPLLREGHTSPERRWRYAQIAEQIMGYLVEHGSAIRFLGFWPPNHIKSGPQDADDDGHTWPYYFYRRGTVSIDTDGSSTFVRSTAVPCSYADIERAYP